MEAAINKTTLAELGACLPVGIQAPEGIVRGFSSRPWKTKDEKEIGKRRKANESPGSLVNLILSYMLSSLGPHEWPEPPVDEKKRAEREFILSRLFMGDVLYMFIWLRRDRSEEHTSELQSRENLVCRLLLEKKKKKQYI